MKLEIFIANRLTIRDLRLKRLSYLIIRITTVAVALSLATMILSVVIVIGFKREIEYKISHFAGHILITKHTSNRSFELQPIAYDSTIVKKILRTEGVDYVQAFAIKPSLVKHKQIISGIVLKGVWTDFNWKFFQNYLKEGRKINLPKEKSSKEIIISEELARKMNYKLGDNVFIFFVENPPRMRKYKIVGIYNTGLVDFDQLYALVDIREIQKLNDWPDTAFMISGYEVFLKNIKNLDEATSKLKAKIAFNVLQNTEKLKVRNVKELYPDIFDWLALVDVNVYVILTIMIVIAILNMTTGLLIIILEKTNFIGILKALGARNSQIVKIFLIIAWHILWKGLVWGNFIGLGLAIVQKVFHVIPLNPETYYVSYVPVSIDLIKILLLNLLVVIITLTFMILPSLIATKIEPAKTIKFE